jgi:hypothetical protein
MRFLESQAFEGAKRELAARRPAQPRPTKPASIITQVEGSGTPVGVRPQKSEDVPVTPRRVSLQHSKD